MAVTRGCSSGAVWLLTFSWEATFVHLLVVDLTPLALAKRRRRGHGGVRGRSRALGAAGCESCCLRATSHSRETKLPSTGQECSYSLSAHELWAAAPWHAGLPSVALLHSSCKTPCRKKPCVMVGIASCTLAPPWTCMRGLFVYSRRGCSVADSVFEAAKTHLFWASWKPLAYCLHLRSLQDEPSAAQPHRRRSTQMPFRCISGV